MPADPQHPDTPSPGPDGKPHEQQPKWRRDFPIDVPQDNYVARRDFLKFMVLTSGAFTVGQFWIGLDHLLSRGRGAPPQRAIIALDELPVGGSHRFHYPTEDDPCLLVRTDEETVLAYSQKCTHLACAVQPDVEAGKFHCPCHNGWFNMADGQPIAGPPQRPLPRIHVELRDGMIYATGLELRT